MNITIQSRNNCLFVSIPYKRNQDVVQFFKKGSYNLRYGVSVVDGWNNPNLRKGDTSGRIFARTVAKSYPKILLSTHEKHFPTRAHLAAKKLDEQLLQKYPAHVSSVGAFIFSFEEFEYIVSVGSIWVLEWTGTHFRHLPGIHQYSLNPTKYPSDCSRFFGRGELKDDVTYSCEPDVVKIDAVTPIFIATDGLSKIMTLTEFNAIAIKPMRKSGKDMIFTIVSCIHKLQTQSDDITLFLRDPR